MTETTTNNSILEHIYKRKSISCCVFGPVPTFKKQFFDALKQAVNYHSFNVYKAPKTILTCNQSIGLFKDDSILSCRIWKSNFGEMTVKIVNPYLIDEAYHQKDIKFFDCDLSYIKDEDVKEQKYDITEQSNQMMEIKHILAADSFMIVYDVRFVDELDTVKEYLNKIFDIKGYNKLIQKMKQDEMCFFPITLIGINKDIPIQECDINRHKMGNVSIANIGKFSIEYNVDFLRMCIFDMSRIDGSYYWETAGMMRDDIKAFVDNVLTYYHYRTCDDEKINKLKANKSGLSCCIF
eukprot:197933_1